MKNCLSLSESALKLRKTSKRPQRKLAHKLKTYLQKVSLSYRAFKVKAVKRKKREKTMLIGRE